jgi:hypothetical protein
MSTTCCNSYEVGASVKLTVTCRDSLGRLADPTALIVKVQSPTLALSTYTFGASANLTRLVTLVSGSPVTSTVGEFQCIVNATEASTAAGVDWEYRWEATGAVVGVASGYFKVKASRF